MKPINDLAFKNICEDFSCKCMGYCSEATYITMEEIAHDCDPYTYDEEDAKNNFLNTVLNIYSLVMTKEGFKEYVGEYLEMAIDLRLNPEAYRTGGNGINIEDLDSPIEDIDFDMLINAQESINAKEENELNYDDFDSFVKDIDYDFLNKNLQRCWERACVTDKPFKEDDLFKFLDDDLIEKN